MARSQLRSGKAALQRQIVTVPPDSDKQVNERYARGLCCVVLVWAFLAHFHHGYAHSTATVLGLEFANDAWRFSGRLRVPRQDARETLPLGIPYPTPRKVAPMKPA